MEIDDQALLRRQRHFLMEVERDIRAANREVIHERIPRLSRRCFIDLGRIVARTRAEYLAMAIRLRACVPGSDDEAAALAAMPGLREAFFEAREAFAALERAIERGYIDIETNGR